MRKSAYEIVQNNICGSCGYYRRHYVQVRHPKHRYFMPLAYGHCVYPRLKPRAPGQSCPRWETAQISPNERG